MIKQLLRDSLIYGLANLLAYGTPILLVPIYTRFFSPDEYGMLDMLTLFASLASLGVALEISQGLARHYPVARGQDDRTAYASTALWFSAAAYTLFTIVCLLLAGPLTRLLLEDASQAPVFRVAVAAIALSGIQILMQNQLRWSLRAKAFAWVCLLSVTVNTAVALGGVVFLQWGLTGLFCGQIAGAVTGILLSGGLARSDFRWTFSWDKAREMLAFSVPLVPSSLSVFLNNAVDRIAIREFLGLASLGVYGVGYRFASIVYLFFIGLSAALTPLIYQHFEKPSTPPELARIFRYFLAATLPLVLALALFAREITWLFAAPAYASAWSVISILSVAFILSRMYIFAPGLDIAKKTGQIAGINLAAAGTNMILNVILVPPLGIDGAALATYISASVMFGLYMSLSQRAYPVPHRWRPIGLAALLTLLPVLLSYPVLRKQTDWTWTGTGLKILVLTGVSWLLYRLLVKGAGDPAGRFTAGT